MKKTFLLLIFCGSINLSHAQFKDSLLRQLPQAKNDTARFELLTDVGIYYTLIRQDSAIYYLAQGIELAQKMNYTYGVYYGFVKLAFVLNTVSNYPKALEFALKSLRIAEQLHENRLKCMADSYAMMAIVNLRAGNDSLSVNEAGDAIALYEVDHTANTGRNFGPYMDIALVKLKSKLFDSALFYANKGHEITLSGHFLDQSYVSVTASTLAHIYEDAGKYDLARNFYHFGIESDKRSNTPLLRARLFNNYARYFKKIGQADSCIYYASRAFEICKDHTYGEHATDAARLISETYEFLHQPDSALKYAKLLAAAKDTIFSQAKLQQLQLLNFDEGQRQRDMNAAKERYRNKVKYYALLAAAAVFLFVAIFLFRNNRNKQRANRILELQKKEIDAQRTKAESTLSELRSTQAQLIQSEKMASLGELTAGIAHEIQNPLNFVNNFSEVNGELLQEMNTAFHAGHTREGLALADDILENNTKISLHGKRAESIVKGMLQHSRLSTGSKEPTPINNMVEEYLRLSYNGMRAKDKSFNVALQTQLDPAIETIEIIPQDIGRVLLNIFNNAYYTVSEKKKNSPGAYEPLVLVSTMKKEGQITISIKDNGNGIPSKIVDKIFQPFFTTKPTGQGTGLGLSLSYDIIKAHGGKLQVNSNEGEGTEFVIQLPIQ